MTVLDAQWVGIVVSAVVSITLGGVALWIAAGSKSISREALDLAKDQDARYAILWVLTHVKGNRDQLENAGGQDAHGVVIEGPNVRDGPLRFDVLHARSALDFIGFTSGQRVRQPVTVTWHRQPDRADDPKTWSAPLPPNLDEPRRPRP